MLSIAGWESARDSYCLLGRYVVRASKLEGTYIVLRRLLVFKESSSLFGEVVSSVALKVASTLSRLISFSQ